MSDLQVMTCFYCSRAISPPNGYGPPTPGYAQGVEASFRWEGTGPRRVEYVLALCPSCYRMLYPAGWSLLKHRLGMGQGWITTIPSAPTSAPALRRTRTVIPTARHLASGALAPLRLAPSRGALSHARLPSPTVAVPAGSRDVGRDLLVLLLVTLIGCGLIGIVGLAIW